VARSPCVLHACCACVCRFPPPRALQALGIGEDDPPPWLVNMQRYGPPPSYPHLRIPGLNAPIPAGARYGFGASEWGKPPVDSKGNPLYGGAQGWLTRPLCVVGYHIRFCACGRGGVFRCAGGRRRFCCVLL